MEEAFSLVFKERLERSLDIKKSESSKSDDGNDKTDQHNPALHQPSDTRSGAGFVIWQSFRHVHRPAWLYPSLTNNTNIVNRQFISSRGNEYFCEIDEDYLTDRFNLTGLNTEVQYYQYALDLVTDVFDMEVDDDMREQIEKSARHLYGLVHARYIVTTRGLAKMVS